MIVPVRISTTKSKKTGPKKKKASNPICSSLNKSYDPFVAEKIENFTQITQIFKNNSQNNPLFRLFPKIPHFEEEAPDELVSVLKIREEAPIELASPPCVANPIGACVVSFKWGANWSDTYVCFEFFLKNIVDCR